MEEIYRAQDIVQNGDYMFFVEAWRAHRCKDAFEIVVDVVHDEENVFEGLQLLLRGARENYVIKARREDVLGYL